MWTTLFTDCAAILFFISLSDYDQTLEEEEGKGKNCLSEALGLFKVVVDQTIGKSVILFMNKEDLLRQKASTSPMQKFHPKYDPDFE